MDEVFDSLAGLAQVTDPGVTTGKMFGSRALKVLGKLFCVVHSDGIVCKLDGDDHAEALAIEGAHLFDPSGKGRPMREWVHIPAGREIDEYESFALAACEYVRSLVAD